MHHQPVLIKNSGLDPIRHAYFRAIKLLVAGRLVNDGTNAPAKFGQEGYLQITILEHVGLERAIDDGLVVERPADESVLRIGRVLDGAPRNRRLAERHSVGHRRRRMHDGMKRTDRPKNCNRETDTGTRGSMNCHLRRLRMSGSNNPSTSTRPHRRRVSTHVFPLSGRKKGQDERVGNSMATMAPSGAIWAPSP